MTEKTENLVEEARRAQSAVYLATEKSVADDLARIIAGLADALEAATSERDAALAAIERVTAIAERHGVKSWTEEIFAALDALTIRKETP